MTKAFYATSLMALMGALPPGAFAQDIHISLTDLATCGAKADNPLPTFFGPFANALWFSSSKFSFGSQTTVALGSASSGAGAGKPTFLPITFTKQSDVCYGWDFTTNAPWAAGCSA